MATQESMFHSIPVNTPTLCELRSEIVATDKRYAVGTFRGGLVVGTLVIAERDHRDRYILELPTTGEQHLYTKPPVLEPVSAVHLDQLRYLFCGSEYHVARQAFVLLAAGVSTEQATGAIADSMSGRRIDVTQLRAVTSEISLHSHQLTAEPVESAAPAESAEPAAESAEPAEPAAPTPEKPNGPTERPRRRR